MQTPNRRTAFKNSEIKITPATILFASRWVEGGKTAVRSLSPNLAQALARIEQLRRTIQVCFKVLLPAVRRQWELKSLKQFCEELIEDCRGHEWRTSLFTQHASLRKRVAVASSLFLFRKVIPQELSAEDIRIREKKYLEKMTTPQETLSKEWVEHVVKHMSRNFKVGWDHDWKRTTEVFTLPTSACVENPRSKGGPRGLDRLALREEYRAFVSGKDVRLSGNTELCTIWTGGKWRLVSKFEARRSFLSPVHQLIYNHLSKKDWLLRGEATQDRFKGFTRRDGEIFVSGDYESATDNLNISLSHLMLDCMRRTSRYIPCTVWREARKALVAKFSNGEAQCRGQLMGSLLSFPLLCLANFLAFKWAVKRKVPLAINGDDIVFRCRPEEAEKWFKEIAQSGLTISKGKTLTAKSVFSLNSTFFHAGESVKLCPLVRSTCLFGAVEDPHEISGRLLNVYSGNGAAKDHVQSIALREMSKQIWSTQRSVRRGLDAKLSWRALKWAGLKERENFYNSLSKEVALPVKLKSWLQNSIPDNYIRVSTTNIHAQDDPDFMKDMIECCWTRDPIKRDTGAYWQKVKEKTLKYVPPIAIKFAIMAGMTKKQALEYSNRTVNTPVTKRKLVWVRAPNGVEFASGGDVSEQL
nr:MAG: RNA-dependent RNA polymerase [Botourmiaviridae sp.]